MRSFGTRQRVLCADVTLQARYHAHVHAPAETSRRFLHVANGTCTTRLIEAAGLPGTPSIWADPLHDGPVPGGVDDEALIEIRAQHLAGDDGAGVNPVNDLRRWRAAIAAHDTYDELVLWFEHDLFDQLNLVQLLTWIDERLPRQVAISLVSIGSFPGRPHFMGIGELTPAELAPLFTARRRVTPEQVALAQRTWKALRAATPEALDEIRRSDTGALPFLAPALTRFLQEYPSTRDGLSRSERRLLELAASGPVELQAAFPQMTGPGDLYHVTDLAVAALADTLSASSPPLLTCLPAPDDAPPLEAVIAITAAGREVLAGRADYVGLCGIDRWLGGVHLHGAAAAWRWDDAADRVVAMDPGSA